jgi:poly(3-hydroxybutyrate) depolymerase
VFVNAAYDENEATRLIFFFHGNTASNAEARDQNMHDLVGTGAIMVYPIGLPYGSDDVPSDELGVGNQLTWSIVEQSRDTDFFDAMVEQLSAEYCIDKARIFVMGQSRGAFFSNLLACVRPAVVRAGAPMSGGVPPVLLRGEAPCTPKPMFLRNAVNDDSGGNPERFGDPAREFWLETNACSMNTSPHAPEGAVEYQNCTGESTLIVYADDGGHGIPSAIMPDIYNFFAAFE